MITSGITAYQSTGSRLCLPIFLSHLSRAHAELGQFDEAWRCIGEAMAAMETAKERWCEAEVNRIAGEIALQVAGARCGKSGSLFRARARSCASAASKILGTARRNEYGAAVARPRKAAASSRTARSGLRLVHRRVRDARSEGGEGVNRRARVMTPFVNRRVACRVVSNNGLKWAICSVRSEGRSVGCSGRPLDAFSSRRKRPAWSSARGAGRAWC